ncbi:MAG: gfo/Idh/MocA family oxidoreductase [Hydrogenothermus sp.]|nr:MAG: gfo/Idh/MocA family oxidoreductase [Hydrogenothermus sp.]
MKVAIVGVGNMGRHYASKFKILGYSPILVDTNPNILEKYDESYRKYTNLDEALNKEDIEYMFIATSPKLHIPLAKKALERNINTMIEKPPTLNPKELEEAINLAEKNGVYLGVSEIELRSSVVRNFQKDSKVNVIQAYRLNARSGYINPFFDLAWHDIYILQYLFGNIKLKQVEDKGDIFEIYGETDKTDFFLQVAWNYPNVRREWILKTKEGEIIFDFVNDTIKYPDGIQEKKDNTDKLELMIKQFIQNPSFESSYRALQILEEFNKFDIKERIN